MKYFFAVVCAMLTMSSSAHAQGAAQNGTTQKQLASRFAAADTDHDGKLTRSEADAGMPRVASRFDEIDAAHTGYVTLEQIQKFVAALKK